MKCKLLSLVLFFLSCSHIVLGQKSKITGIVKDSLSGQTLNYANIRLLHTDSTLYLGTISDTNGIFQFNNLEAGEYICIVEYLGYKSYYINLSITGKSKKTDLGVINLAPSFEMLDGVVIEERLKYKNLIDRVVYVPDSSDIANSLTSLELLDKVSDLHVNKANNSVSIKGHEATLILINGIEKPGLDLRSINPADVSEIHVITSPTSEYESGIDGVINIILKENPTKGFSLLEFTDYMPVSKTIEQGLYLQYGANKTRFNLDYIYSHKNFLNEKVTERTIGNNNVYKNISKSLNHPETYQSLSLSIDYYLNEKNYFNYSSENNFSVENFQSYSQASNLVGNDERYKVNSLLNTYSKYFLSNHTVYFKRKFKKEGHEFTINNNIYISNILYDYRYNDSLTQDSNNVYIINRANKENAKKISNNLKLDYTLPVTNSFYIFAGTFMYFQNVNNQYNTNSSGSYLYKNIKHAYYIDIYKKFKSWNIRLGGRGESIRNTYEDSVIYEKTKFLPSVVVSKTINNKQQVSLSYRKIIFYPSMWQLTPYISYEDSLNATQGNAFLRPTISENINLQYTIRNRDNLIKIGCYYAILNDFMGIYNFIEQSNFSLRKVVNFDKEINAGITLSTSHVFFNNFEFETSSRFFNEKIFNNITGQIRDNNSYSIDISVTYSFLENYYFWANASFNGKILAPQGYYKPQNVVSAICIERNIFKRKGTVGIIYSYPLSRNKTEYIYNEGNASIDDFFENKTSGVLFKLKFYLTKGMKVENLQFEKHMEKDVK